LYCLTIHEDACGIECLWPDCTVAVLIWKRQSWWTDTTWLKRVVIDALTTKFALEPEKQR
jgi:hypothetical protein